MVSDREAWLADKVRKALTLLLSAFGTWLLFRIVFRIAEGRQRLLDIELLGLLLTVAVAVVWIRAAQRVPRQRPNEDETSLP